MVARAGTTFGRAGGELDGALHRRTNAASTLGSAFVNDGAAVYDRGTHLGNLPAGFGDAGSRLAGTSSRLAAVADDLATMMAATASAVSGLHAELAQMRSQWAARVTAAGRGPGRNADLQLVLGHRGPVRVPLVVLGDRAPGDRHLDRRVRGPGRPTGHRPADGPGRARTGSGGWPASMRSSSPGAAGGAVLAWFDGRRWEFDGCGRIARTWAGPGTAVTFTHVDGRLAELTH